MKDLEDIRGRCRMVDGHWLWAGGLNREMARVQKPVIHAPDYTLGGLRPQPGARAVWHSSTGRAIPAGHVVYVVCDEPLCLNPGHLRCGTRSAMTRFVAERDGWKGHPLRVQAGRRNCPNPPKLSLEQVVEIQRSDRRLVDWARELQVNVKVVSRAKHGHYRTAPAAGMFSALLVPTRGGMGARHA